MVPKLFNLTSIFLFFRNILAMALNELDTKENVTEAPSNCNTSGALWETGKKLFEYIRRQTLPDGTTGRVAFDEMGDRIYAEYQIVNMQKSGRSNQVQKVTVGYYNYSNVSAKHSKTRFFQYFEPSFSIICL